MVDKFLEFKLKYRLTPDRIEKLLLLAMEAEESEEQQWSDFSFESHYPLSRSDFEYEPGSYKDELTYNTLKLIKELSNEHF